MEVNDEHILINNEDSVKGTLFQTCLAVNQACFKVLSICRCHFNIDDFCTYRITGRPAVMSKRCYKLNIYTYKSAVNATR